MSRLVSSKRAKLPASAFAYIDSRGRRRLPIHDEAHVRNALGRFDRVAFEDDAARERARRRLLNAAKRYGIVPVGFITGEVQKARTRPAIDALPTGFVTFLFTDIEGSTALLTLLGDRYGALLRDVRGVIRRRSANTSRAASSCPSTDRVRSVGPTSSHPPSTIFASASRLSPISAPSG